MENAHTRITPPSLPKDPESACMTAPEYTFPVDAAQIAENIQKDSQLNGISQQVAEGIAQSRNSGFPF